jgi:hypothetical protein
MVTVCLLARYPGVVCVTPLAWLLALVSGNRYVELSKGRADPQPLLAPALLGALLGLEQGIVFVLVSSLGMPPETPADAQKAAWLSVVVVVLGMLICAALSAAIAWLRLRRSADH